MHYSIPLHSLHVESSQRESSRFRLWVTLTAATKHVRRQFAYAKVWACHFSHVYANHTRIICNMHTLFWRPQIHVRLWGQYFTEAAWGGVLGALRSAPAALLGGAAGKAAGVPKLLEAYVDLVAMQVRK